MLLIVVRIVEVDEAVVVLVGVPMLGVDVLLVVDDVIEISLKEFSYKLCNSVIYLEMKPGFQCPIT